ncbi:MAG TPA: hypothetical protein VNW97_22010 [Candidatus Saccharimonadales bacterium]|nr:hypothetical protein [Candidatus Saccharimonadales bacterium]
MTKHSYCSLLLRFALAVLPVLAQGQGQSKPSESAPQAAPGDPTAPAARVDPEAPLPKAQPGDVDTVEHLSAAVYDVISGPAGQSRDWNRFRSLFYPGIGRLIPSGRNSAGVVSARSLTPEEYIERASPVFSKEGFFESSVANRIEIWDHLAQVWSTYESRHAKDSAPFARGINSFQFMYDGKRWWVMTIYWEGEQPAHPLPEKYLR